MFNLSNQYVFEKILFYYFKLENVLKKTFQIKVQLDKHDSNLINPKIDYVSVD